MRDIEFRELKVGDFIFSGCDNDVWTIASPFPRHKTFILLQGRWHFKLGGKIFWSVVARLPDKMCLEIADCLEVRIARVFNPAKWTKIAD
ncbi:MAG: hypothetical protein HYZ69_03250 [Candidatus Colwellbacteria bacterium]|nr:hypothetical protein [Candidatus Colwellbacteria bacterium]